MEDKIRENILKSKTNQFEDASRFFWRFAFFTLFVYGVSLGENWITNLLITLLGVGALQDFFILFTCSSKKGFEDLFSTHEPTRISRSYVSDMSLTSFSFGFLMVLDISYVIFLFTYSFSNGYYDSAIAFVIIANMIMWYRQRKRFNNIINS